MNPEKWHPRTLENGLQILNENITQDDDSITFEFTCDRPVKMGDMQELWQPQSTNRLIIDKLIEKGWIAEDFTSLLHFKMDVAVNSKENKIKFHYYKAQSPLNDGLQHVN